MKRVSILTKFNLVVFANLLLSCWVLVGPEVQAQDETERELPKSGILASVQLSGYASQAMPGSWGQDNLFEGSGAPLTGSISVQGKDIVARISNVSESVYSGSVRLIQRDVNGRNLNTKHYSFGSLKPGQAKSFSTRKLARAGGAVLELTRYRSRSSQKSKSKNEEEE